MTLLAALALALAAWVLGRALLADDAPLRARLAATLTAGLFVQAVAFNLLTSLHLFRRPAALALAAALAAALAPRLIARRAELARDLRAASASLGALLRDPLTAAMALCAAAVVAFRVLRATVSPALAWDSLTYHLVRPVLWVQHGFDPVERAPDQVGYLTFFPRGGDVPWAWSMLLTRSSAWVAATGALVWAMVPLAAACLARELGARPREAARAGLGAALIPCLVNLSTSGYVDNFVTASWLLAGLFLARSLRGAGGGELVLAAMALSVHAGSKLSGLPLLACGLTVAALAWWRRGPADEPRRWAWPVAALGVAAAALLPAYLRTLLATGSPLWPLALELGGHTLLPGHPQLADLYSLRLDPPSADERAPWRFAGALMLPKFDYGAERLDWGEQVVAVIALALVGLPGLARDRAPGRRAAAALLLALSAVPLAAALSDDYVAIRTTWALVAGRLVVTLPVMLYVLAARARGPVAAAGWTLVLLSSLHSAWPQGTSPAMRSAMSALARSPARVEAVRERYRWDIWAEAARVGPDMAYELHSVEVDYADAWPLWRFLDDGAPHRVAAAFGWDGVGHNAYRLPLFGSRWQNAVLYVPVTADGSIVDQDDPARLRRRADPEAWLRRLDEQRIEYVVVTDPAGVERGWIEARPDRFSRAAVAAGGRHALWRLLPAAR